MPLFRFECTKDFTIDVEADDIFEARRKINTRDYIENDKKNHEYLIHPWSGYEVKESDDNI